MLGWFFRNPKVIAVAGAVLAVLAFVWRVLVGAKRAGVNEQKAKEAEARDANLKKIQDAIDASNRIDPDVMRDPNNRLRK